MTASMTHPRTNRRLRAGSLIIGGLLLFPAVPFLVLAQSGANPAEQGGDMPEEAKESSGAGAQTAGSDEKSVRAVDFPDLLRSLEERRRSLDERERRVKAAERRLEALKTEVAEKLRELEMARENLEFAYGQASAQRLRRLKKMAPSYEGMKPENAAKVIAGLSNPEALSLLELMEARKVSKILDAMEADRAIELSKELHRIVPKP